MQTDKQCHWWHNFNLLQEGSTSSRVSNGAFLDKQVLVKPCSTCPEPDNLMPYANILWASRGTGDCQGPSHHAYGRSAVCAHWLVWFLQLRWPAKRRHVWPHPLWPANPSVKSEDWKLLKNPNPEGLSTCSPAKFYFLLLANATVAPLLYVHALVCVYLCTYTIQVINIDVLHMCVQINIFVHTQTYIEVHNIHKCIHTHACTHARTSSYE